MTSVVAEIAVAEIVVTAVVIAAIEPVGFPAGSIPIVMRLRGSTFAEVEAEDEEGENAERRAEQWSGAWGAADPASV